MTAHVCTHASTPVSSHSAARLGIRAITRVSAQLMVAIWLGLSSPLAQLGAQTAVTGGAPDLSSRLPAIWVGAGLAAGSGSANSAALATGIGGLFMAAIELPMRRTIGPATLSLRAEGRWSQQPLDAVTGSGISGDVQTLSTGITVRGFPLLSGNKAPRRVTPYLLAGVGIERPSTRVRVSINNPDMPTARFAQTSSEIAPTGLGGLGGLFLVGRAQLFAEVRTEFASRDAGTLRSSFGTVGIAFQPHR